MRLIATAFLISALTRTASSQAIERVDLGGGVYLFTAPSSLDFWTASNSVVIVDDAGVVVFDSNARPSTTRLVIAEIRKLTSKPVRTLINSHWHMDHWIGNAEYAKAFPGVQIIATTETRDYMKRMPIAFFANMIGAEGTRARADTVIRNGKMADGRTLTPELRATLEANVRTAQTVAAEIASTQQALPTTTFDGSMLLMNGSRELRLFSATGDATGSAVLYLPRERILVTGDVLVRAESNDGAQPWTTNSYKITPWLASLREFAKLDISAIVPGQGGVLRDKTYLNNTIALYEAVISQVHSALERGAVTLKDVEQAIDLKAIRTRFTNDDQTLNTRFDRVAARLVQKVLQEARDGLTPQ